MQINKSTSTSTSQFLSPESNYYYSTSILYILMYISTKNACNLLNYRRYNLQNTQDDTNFQTFC